MYVDIWPEKLMVNFVIQYLKSKNDMGARILVKIGLPNSGLGLIYNF